jgi:DNA-directed RNA polymerase subunit RPC12/RpoP
MDVITMLGKIDKMKRLRVIGDFLMLGAFFMLISLFLSAYLSNNFRTTIHINNYGEAHIEMIILVFFLLPLSLITVTLSFMDWKQTWKAKGKIMSERNLLMENPILEAPIYDNVPVSGTLVCPRCKARFEARVNYMDGKVMCPSCGLSGVYSPRTSEPSVKIIKDIRH